MQAMVDAVEARADGLGPAASTGGVLLDAFGGAINRVPAGRDRLRPSVVALPGTDLRDVAHRRLDAATADNQRWLQTFWRSMRPWASGFAYQNYIDPNLRDWQRAYYGTNLGRLVDVKTAYDPDDVFRFAQSIPVHD